MYLNFIIFWLTQSTINKKNLLYFLLYYFKQMDLSMYSPDVGMVDTSFMKGYKAGAKTKSKKRKASGIANTKSRPAKKSKNSLYTTTKRKYAPRIINKDKSVIIKHKEFVKNVTSSINWSMETVTVNPGLSDSFPWLASVAENFESYEFKNVHFKYKSICTGEPTSITNIGTVVLFPQYNVAQQQPLNKQTAESFHDSTSFRPTANGRCFIKSELLKARRYVRTERDTYLNNVDLRLYDLCNFVIGTQDNPADNTVVGELWCYYEVVLYNPRLPPLPIDVPQYWNFQITSSDTTVSNTYPLGTKRYEPSDVGGYSTDASVTLNANAQTAGTIQYSSIDFDPSLTGYFSIFITVYGGQGTAAVCDTASMTPNPLGNITADKLGGPSTSYSNNGNTSLTTLSMTGWKIVGPSKYSSNFIELNNALLPPGWTTVVVMVSRVSELAK